MATNESRDVLVALATIAKLLEELPLELAATTGKTTEEILERRHAKEKSELDTLAFGRDEGFGGNRIQDGAQDLYKQAGVSFRKIGSDLVGGATDAAGNASAKVATLLGARFTAALGPLALFNTALNQSTSGLGMVQKSANLVASVFAPILLPATTLISAGLIAVSDILMGKDLHIMSEWFDFVLDRGIPALEQFVRAVDYAAEAANWFAKVRKEVSEKEGSEGALFGPVGAIGKALGINVDKSFLFGPAGGASDIKPESEEAKESTRRARDTVGSALSDVMKSLRLSLGPRAQITGLESVGRGVQLAALNQDPLEARLMRQQIAILERIEAAIRRNQRRAANERVYDPEKHGLADDTGSVAFGGGDF